MDKTWPAPGTRSFWIISGACFLALELALRIKLGSIAVLALGWVIAHQWLTQKLGGPYERDPVRRIYFGFFSALVVCAVIFLVFAVLNIGIRSLINHFRWFQLP